MRLGQGAFILFLLCCFCCVSAAGAFAASRGAYGPFTKPFTHYAENENICAVLADFARAEGYTATCSPALKGTVSGRFDMVPGNDFIAGMASAFGVRWYTLGRSLYFWHEGENSRAFLAPATVAARELYTMFQAAGMISPQLPLTVLSAQNLISAGGPPMYINQLRDAMTAFEAAQSSRTVMRVFPLRYAWAEDMSVNSMDAMVTIPGVASILRAMVTGAPLAGGTTTLVPPAQERLLGQGLMAVGRATSADASGTSPTMSPTMSQDGAVQQMQNVNIIADPRVNAVVVTDAEYRMSYYTKVINDLDKPVALVEIHAAIVDIDSNFSRNLGINYSGGVQLGENWQGGGAGGAASPQGMMPPAGAAANAGFSFTTLYTQGADYFLARINALEEDGTARVLGKPSVLTMDNIQASLENTSTYYIPVAGKEVSDLFRVDSGTVLKVTPHIIPGVPGARDSIKLMVSVQDNRDDGAQAFSVDVSKLAPIKQTKINTQAIVGEGQSLLIGGYYFETQSDADAGIPGLKNIPVLGGLFGSTEKKHKRMERLILITPRIVRLGVDQQIPPRVDDLRFSRTPTQANYDERAPLSPPVGGCARRSAVAPAQPVAAEPAPMPRPVPTPVTQPLAPVAAPPAASTAPSAPSAPSADAGQAVPALSGARGDSGGVVLPMLKPTASAGSPGAGAGDAAVPVIPVIPAAAPAAAAAQ